MLIFFPPPYVFVCLCDSERVRARSNREGRADTHAPPRSTYALITLVVRCSLIYFHFYSFLVNGPFIHTLFLTICVIELTIIIITGYGDGQRSIDSGPHRRLFLSIPGGRSRVQGTASNPSAGKHHHAGSEESTGFPGHDTVSR
jgi:hypothetical protein